MLNTNSLEIAIEKARKNKKGLAFFSEAQLCDCTRCYNVETVPRDASTIVTHRRRYGRHPDALPMRTAPICTNNPGLLIDSTMGGTEIPTFQSPDDIFPHYPHSEIESQHQLGSVYCSLAPSSSAAHLNSRLVLPSAMVSGSDTCSGSPAPSQSPDVAGFDYTAGISHLSEARNDSLYTETVSCAHNDSGSDESDDLPDDYVLKTTDPKQDAQLFGPDLALFKVVHPPTFHPKGSCPSHGDPGGEEDEENDEDDDEDDDEEDEGDEEEPDDPDNPDEGAEVEDQDAPPIQIDPNDEPGPPGGPGDDGDAQGMRALDEHPILCNIYLRTWVQYAFAGATQDSVQAMLESHKSALLALAELGAQDFPPNFVPEVQKMPTTLRSLERRLGLDFTDLITIYPVCPDPDCGKRYTMEQLEMLRNPQCTRHVGEERCPGLLYSESTLANGKQRRTPTKSFPYNSLLAALGRLLSRPGIAELMQHWRRGGDEPVEGNVPPPLEPGEWFHRMGPGDKFGDITQAWAWRNQEVGLRRRWDDALGEYIDEPTGDAPLSLARLPLGISLGLNMDGFQAFRGKFAAGGSYSVNGVYIVVNNLPFYLRMMIENMILAIVMPGPKEPKGYAMAQMLEPLVNDLIELADGVDLPVYNANTGEVEERRVYAQLSVFLMDWIARIDCIGHVGVTAEHNHCPYCKIRQCLLGEARGYQPAGYEMRDPHEHLQAKHEWLRAPEPDREAIRQRTGTTFTIFDRIPGLYSFDICPPDSMHLFDLGITPAIVKFVYQLGMLRKRYHRQPVDQTPEARFDAFISRCYFPHFCSRLPTEIAKMNSRTKAEQWSSLLVVLPAALFEAWKVGDSIPGNEIPRGGRNTKHYKKQKANAQRLLRRRLHTHEMDEGELDDLPELDDCYPSRNPQDYFGNILRYRVAHAVVTQHRVSRLEIDAFTPLFELVGATFTEMNINLPPIFHAATHLRPFLLKYGGVYGTRIPGFERANRMLINVNTNGHGQGVLEATMAKGFLRRAKCYRYVKVLQSIEDPTNDDTKTTKVLLDAMRNGPEHEIQRGMLDAVLAGQAPFRGQEHIRLATTSAKIDFNHLKHSTYYRHMIDFCNEHYPFNNARFYGPGVRPPNGVYISPNTSTVSYPHFHRYGVRYGSAHHQRGYRSRFGYTDDQVPVLIKGIYGTTVAVGDREFTFVAAMVRRFIPPAQEPVFPWNHWNDLLGIGAWEHRQFAPVEAVPLSAFTGVFAMSDIQMSYGHYTLTFAMVKTRPQDLVEGYVHRNANGNKDGDEGVEDDEGVDDMDED